MTKGISLTELKNQMATEDAKRQSVIEQGRRAWHLGIEKNNCPLKELSARNLWVEGWEKARKEFDATPSQRGGPMRH